jgi:hypothetical protein
MRKLDSDYDGWRQERYSKFSDEFGQWRASRSAQGAGQSGAGLSGTVDSSSAKSSTGNPGSPSPSSTSTSK